MRHLGILILILGTSCAALHAQQPAPDSAIQQRQAPRSSYDPMAQGKAIGQPKGIVETTLAGVNPRNTDYGIAVADWRKEVFENTLRQFYFWSLLALTLMFGASLMANGWFMRERDRRLTISADLVAQLYNAYVTSRARAFEAIGKHNRLVEKCNRLDTECAKLKAEMTEVVQTEAPGVNYDLAKQDRNAQSDPREEQDVLPNLPPATDELGTGEASDVDQLRAKLTQTESILQRKTAQLQASNNQITNLRKRLTQAHDTLQGRRQDTGAAKQ
jgi:uncharacterized protein (UPF0335 family)